MNKIAAIILVLLLSTVTLARAQFINTGAVWDGHTTIGPFGEPGLATIGQVFTAPIEYTQLESFAFTLNWLGGGSVYYAAAVAEWDPINLHPTNAPLFTSGLLTLPPSTGFIPTIVSTGGISLKGNTQYVAFLTTSAFFDGVVDWSQVGFIGSDVYAGGGAVALNNGSDIPALTVGPWLSTPADLAFAAAFSAVVPEPSTYGLVGAAALAALMCLARRSRVQSGKTQ